MTQRRTFSTFLQRYIKPKTFLTSNHGDQIIDQLFTQEGIVCNISQKTIKIGSSNQWFKLFIYDFNNSVSYFITVLKFQILQGCFCID